MCDLGLIVGGQGEQQCALRAQLNIDAACALKLLGKTRPARLALPAERDQRFLAGFGFTARGQHARGGMACAPSGFAAIENGHVGAAGEPPADT